MTSPTPHERFGHVRSLLHQPPSALVWAQLCLALNDWPSSPQLTHEVLPYAKSLLSSWPQSISRPAPPQWWSVSSSSKARERSEALPLANGLRFYRGPLDPAKLRAMLELSAKHQLTHLDLSGARLGLVGARALATMPELRQLYSLRLSKNQLGAEGARVLAQSPHLYALERLDLSENALRLAGLDALLGAGAWDALKHLELYCNELTDAGALRLSQSSLIPQLSSLGLGLNHLCYEGHQSIDALLERVDDAALERLDLHANRLGDVGARMISTAPRLRKLKTLGLRYTFISAQGVNTLMQSELLTALESLDLGSNTIDAFELQPMLWALPSLKRLSLSRTELEDQGFIRLLNAAAFDDLERLKLNDAKLTSSSIQALAQRRELGRLSVLELNDNPINDAGAFAIAQSKHLGSLRRLMIRATQIGPEGLDALKACPQITELLFSE